MSNTKSLVQSYYESHHIQGGRLRQSFLENERGSLFKEWISYENTILDLGGRDGNLTKHFIEGNDVTIGDVDAEALQYAKEKYKVKTEIINLNERLPFSDNKFDVVVMAEVLEHLPYPKVTLSEILRVLKGHGLFIGNLPLSYHLKDRYQVIRGKKLVISGDPTHLQFLSYSDVINLLSEYFEIDEIVILKGGKKANRFPSLFARNIAFKCRPKIK